MHSVLYLGWQRFVALLGVSAKDFHMSAYRRLARLGGDSLTLERGEKNTLPVFWRPEWTAIAAAFCRNPVQDAIPQVRHAACL